VRLNQQYKKPQIHGVNMTTDQYQWRDSRFSETSDMWLFNESNDRSGIIEVFKLHLDNYSAQKNLW
jgi:hypothetical protein